MDAVENHTDFKIYKSSAGSGKTFTLVKEYLRIVLAHPDRYRNVLAITFTNKAAGEMKERIIGELSVLAKGEKSGMRELLIEETGLSQEHIRENARETLSLILHNYANFAVSTIDSFTHRLIRNFARDLDLPSQFEVEMDTDALLTRMVDQLMEAIGQDPFITEILVHFAEEKLKNDRSWQIDRNIREVARELFNDSSKAPISKLQEMKDEKVLRFIDFIRQRKESYPEKISEIGARAIAIIDNVGLSTADFSGGRGSCAKVFADVQNRNSPAEYKMIFEKKNFLKAVAEDAWFPVKSKLPSELRDKVLDDGVRAIGQEILRYHQEKFNDYLTAWHAYQNIHSLAVLKQIEDLIDVHKDQNSLVHISDFQAKISNFMAKEEPDYIYWRLGERFRHYLLDEFQDTSMVQWKNLLPLFEYIRHDLTEGDVDTAEEEKIPGSLLLVGDSKQAIYRWRGGEMELLEIFAPSKLGVEPHVLSSNYRSQEYVVDFNNRFFRKAREILHANLSLRRIYTDFEQEIRPENMGGGLVHIALIEEKKIADVKAEALKRTEDRIIRLQEEGYALQDIAILVRSGKEGSEIAQFLSDAGIRVISSESILLHKEPVVNFIVSLFRFLLDPSDHIPRAEVLHYFYFYLHGDKALDVETSARIRAVLDSDKTIQAIYAELPRAFRTLSFKLDQLPLYELAEEIIQIFELNAVAPAYLQHFLDVILQFSERKKPDLGGFLEHWDEQKHKFSVVVPEGEEAVEILTFHKCKGLEFPVVLIPFANWDFVPRPNHSFWATAEEGFQDYPDRFLLSPRTELTDSAFSESYNQEINYTLLDNLNLMYVAFTRPRERLYVYAHAWRSKRPDTITLGDIKKANILLTLVLEDPEFEGMDELVYETGIPTPPGARKELPASQVADTFLSERWRDRIRIERKFRKYWESGTESSPRKDIDDPTLMCEILRRLEEAERLSYVTTGLQEEGLLSEERKNELDDQLDALLETLPLRAWFLPDLKIRRGGEILTPDGKSYKPDRVIESDNTVIIVDFVDLNKAKPDREKLQNCAETMLQVGFEKAEAWLYYLPDGNAEQVV